MLGHGYELVAVCVLLSFNFKKTSTEQEGPCQWVKLQDLGEGDYCDCCDCHGGKTKTNPTS